MIHTIDYPLRSGSDHDPCLAALSTHDGLETLCADIKLCNFDSDDGLLPDSTKQIVACYNEAFWHSPVGNVRGNAQNIFTWHEFENYEIGITAASNRDQGVKLI